MLGLTGTFRPTHDSDRLLPSRLKRCRGAAAQTRDRPAGGGEEGESGERGEGVGGEVAEVPLKIVRAVVAGVREGGGGEGGQQDEGPEGGEQSGRAHGRAGSRLRANSSGRQVLGEEGSLLGNLCFSGTTGRTKVGGSSADFLGETDQG